MSQSSSLRNITRGILVGVASGQGVYATPTCVTSMSSSRSRAVDDTTTCACPPAIYGAPNQYYLTLPPVVNGTCKDCVRLGGQRVTLTYIGTSDGDCVWESDAITSTCGTATWQLRQNGVLAKIRCTGLSAVPEWQGPSHFQGPVFVKLTTTSTTCIFDGSLVALPVRDPIAGYCHPLAEYLQGVLVGVRDGKAVYAAGPCNVAPGSSSASRQAIPADTKHIGWLVGARENKGVYVIHCCDPGSSRSRSSASQSSSSSRSASPSASPSSSRSASPSSLLSSSDSPSVSPSSDSPSVSPSSSGSPSASPSSGSPSESPSSSGLASPSASPSSSGSASPSSSKSSASPSSLESSATSGSSLTSDQSVASDQSESLASLSSSSSSDSLLVLPSSSLSSSLESSATSGSSSLSANAISMCECDSMPTAIGITFATIACMPSISGQSFTMTWNGSAFIYASGTVSIALSHIAPKGCLMVVAADGCVSDIVSVSIACIPTYTGGAGTVFLPFSPTPGCACAPGANVAFTLY